MAKCEDIWFCFQKTPFHFRGEMLMEKAECVKWRPAVNFCRNGDAWLSPVWHVEDPACPKNVPFCEPSAHFLLPFWAFQPIHFVHISVVLIWSCHKGMLKAGYSARQYQRVRQDLSLLPRAGLLWLCWIMPGCPCLLLKSLEPQVTLTNLFSLC